LSVASKVLFMNSAGLISFKIFIALYLKLFLYDNFTIHKKRI
jgi:hypothetical protein